MASLIVTHMVFLRAVSAVYYSNFLDPAVIVVLPVPDIDPESSPNESPAGEDPNLPDADRESYHGDGDSEEPMSEDDTCSSDSAPDCSHWSYSRLGTNRHGSTARCRLCGLIWRGGPATFPPWPL
jgi:hypothetical protein